MNKKILLIFCMIFLFITMASATIESLPTVKLGDNVSVIQVVSNVTSCNISTIRFPNSSIAISSVTMPNVSMVEYVYNFNNTETMGTYTVNGLCSDGFSQSTFSYTFAVTNNGMVLSTGQGVVLVGIVLILLFLSLMFFIISLTVKYTPGKLFLIGLGTTFSIFALGSAVSFLQNLFTMFDTFVTSFSQMYFLLLVLAIGGFLGFLMYLIAVVFTFFYKLRGLKDED